MCACAGEREGESHASKQNKTKLGSGMGDLAWENNHVLFALMENKGSNGIRDTKIKKKNLKKRNALAYNSGSVHNSLI